MIGQREGKRVSIELAAGRSRGVNRNRIGVEQFVRSLVRSSSNVQSICNKLNITLRLVRLLSTWLIEGAYYV